MMTLNHGRAFLCTKSSRSFFILTMAIPATLFLSSCSDDDDPPATQAAVQLRTDPTLGAVLTDNSNHTLYSFANDFNGENNCTGGCTALWPVFYAGDNLSQGMLASGLDLADFGTVTTAAGAKQTTFKGWPLYYYAPAVGGTNTQESAGQNTGEGLGGFWHVAKPDYTIRLLNDQLTGNDGKNYTSAYVEGTGKTLYFTDAKGATLYTFTKDSSNNNNFTLPDLSNNGVWPIYETDQVIVPSTLDKALFGSITVFGKKQLTYKGWPLYYFGADNKARGSNKGVSVPVPGIWPVAIKDAPVAPVP